MKEEGKVQSLRDIYGFSAGNVILEKPGNLEDLENLDFAGLIEIYQD